MEQETSPYVKVHEDKTICFADTLIQAKNALERKEIKAEDASKLDGAHLMLFGVEQWKAGDLKSFHGAMKSATNNFSRFEVFGCEMKEADQLAFGDLLDPANLQSVKQFDLDNTRLEPAGARAIFAKLREVSSIEILNLQGSIEGKADVMAAIADELTEKSNIFSSLRKLDLKINELKADSAPHCANLMKRMMAFGGENKSCEVDLFYNDIKADGARHIAEALQSPESVITHLDLSCNDIGDEGAKAIGRMLRGNTSLRVLKLALNNIGTEGGIAIMKALAPRPHDENQAKNKTLEVLDLSANVMKEETMAKPDARDEEANKEKKRLDDLMEELEDDNGNCIEGKEEEYKKLQAEADKIKFHYQEIMPLVEAISFVCTSSYLYEFDFTGIELGNEMWGALGHHLSTTNNKTLQKRGVPMKIRFSIVDLMNEDNLKTLEKYIWGKKENPSSPYHTHKHIEWRRRDDEEKKTG